MICPECRASYDDDELRYCGRCGTDMQRRAVAAGGGARDEPDRSNPRDPMIGRVIEGRYRVLEAIGVGGMGAVYKVEHTAMGKIAALKILHPTLSGDREVVKRFRREAEAVARLNSPHTVQVFDFGAAQGQLFMVMEFIRGEDLGRIVRRDGILPWSRTGPIMVQIW